MPMQPLEQLTRDPLAMTPPRMRELGYRTVDLLVSQLADKSIPAVCRGESSDLQRRLCSPLPAQGRNWDNLLNQLEGDVLPFMSRLAHPGDFAFIPASSTFPGALGDLIASALDIDAGSWLSASGPSQLELVVLDWFKEWIGYPAEAAGSLVSGGSAANITALACARETLVGSMSERLVAYVADQTHSSVARAARLLGFRPDQLRVLPSDVNHRMRLDALVGAVDADVRAGLRPLVVCANAGATNTGAIDPLPELAAICRERGLWLHVDAAYGGFASLTERGRRSLAGIELADSVTLDPHKWLYQPIECGCLLVREGHLLERAFTIDPEYLMDYKGEEVDFADLGLQLTRTSRALKIWLSLNYFGLDAFRAAIDRAIDLALLAEQRVREHPELELLSPASLGIICFRRRFAGIKDEERLAKLNAALVAGFEATGRGLVSSTRLHGTYAVRLCVMNHTSGPGDVEGAIRWFANASPPLPRVSGRAAVFPGRCGDGAGGEARVPEARRTATKLPLLASLADDELEVVITSNRETHVKPGQPVIDLWGGTRDFYVIVEGRAEVRREGQPVCELTTGDFFGELAALDWGAGFSYVRTASVVAASPLKLLVLSPDALDDLMRTAPEVKHQVRREAHTRLKAIERLTAPLDGDGAASERRGPTSESALRPR
jgi:aromatic-L-amino-acid/L-tryptophan decarboxylase